VTEYQIVSLWGVRFLPVLCSILSIPAIYYLAKFAFRSRLVGKMSAFMITLSPYSIYLAQEARHYSLAILLVIASIYCYLKAIHYFFRKKPIPFSLIFTWIIVNAIGIAIHYLLIITIISQAISWLALVWYDRKNIIYGHNGNYHLKQNLQLDRLALLALGTIIIAIIWLPLWRNGLGSELTAWIQGDNYLSLQEIFNPIFQILAAILTMFYLLPIESDNLWVSIPCIVIMVIIFFWLTPILYQALVNYQSVNITNLDPQYMQESDRQNIRALMGIIVGSILIFLGFNYILGIDLTRGARYNFVYFPAVIVLLGVSFSQIYQQDFIKSDWLNLACLPKQGKQIIYLIFLIAFLSSLTVVNNLGYQKYYRPDLLVNTIDNYYANHPIPNQIVMATTYKTHVQIGEILGIVWVWLEQFNDQNVQPTSINSHKNDLPIKFIFNRYNRTHPATTIKSLTDNLQNINQDFDLWLINYQGDFTPNDWQNLQQIPCQNINNQDLRAIDGYHYQIYHCLH
ncbi:MAG: glycosyltransferase family 39 protein, partial [Microcoleaceae cyanobacterium]